jgi:hypothetical protein
MTEKEPTSHKPAEQIFSSEEAEMQRMREEPKEVTFEEDVT